MDVDVSQVRADLEARWRDREEHWARKLGRIRLGVEPIEVQLARYWRSALALMIVPAIIALMFLTLFSVFGRGDIGLGIVVVFFVPIILFAWLGYKTMERRAAAYLAERSRFEDEMRRLVDSTELAKSASEPA